MILATRQPDVEASVCIVVSVGFVVLMQCYVCVLFLTEFVSLLGQSLGAAFRMVWRSNRLPGWPGCPLPDRPPSHPATSLAAGLPVFGVLGGTRQVPRPNS